MSQNNPAGRLWPDVSWPDISWPDILWSDISWPDFCRCILFKVWRKEGEWSIEKKGERR